MKGLAKQLISAVIGAMVSCLLATQAGAVTLLSGSFTFLGSGDYATGTSLSASKLDFGAFLSGTGNNSGTTVGTAGSIDVLLASGDFFGLAGTIGTISDFSSLAAGTGGLAVPVSSTPFISVGGVTFDLGSATVASRDASGLRIEGVGTILLGGFDPTPGIFSLTTTGNGNYFFTSAVSAVPEPAAWELLIGGFGLMGFILRRHARKDNETLLGVARSLIS